MLGPVEIYILISYFLVLVSVFNKVSVALVLVLTKTRKHVFRLGRISLTRVSLRVSIAAPVLR